jgi:DNA-binding NtrC family response regulator
MIEIEPGILWSVDKFPPDQAAVQPTKSRSKRSSPGTPTVLVVDDHRIIADSLADILNDSGFRAIVAYDGREASRIAAEIRPAYLLTDVVMPVMNGVELAIEVAKVSPDTKTLLLSGQTGISDMLREGRERGYEFPLVGKPIHPEKLIEHIKEL